MWRGCWCRCEPDVRICNTFRSHRTVVGGDRRDDTASRRRWMRKRVGGNSFGLPLSVLRQACSWGFRERRGERARPQGMRDPFREGAQRLSTRTIARTSLSRAWQTQDTTSAARPRTAILRELLMALSSLLKTGPLTSRTPTKRTCRAGLRDAGADFLLWRRGPGRSRPSRCRHDGWWDQSPSCVHRAWSEWCQRA